MCDTTSYVLYFFSFNIFTIQRICIYVLTLGQNSREYGVPNEINDDDDDDDFAEDVYL